MFIKNAFKFCFLVLLTLFVQIPFSSGQQEGADQEGGEQWTFEIVRGATLKRQYVHLEINVKGLEEGAQSTFRNLIDTREIGPYVVRDFRTAFTFFEHPKNWEHEAGIQDFQKIELAAIQDQFRKKVRDLVQSKLNSKKSDDPNRWKFTKDEAAEISKELVPLELATEMLALDALLPHQQRSILKTHFSALGWKSLDSVYGSVALGLSEDQTDEIEKIVRDIETDRKKTRQSSFENKREIEKRLWEMIVAELTDEQQRRLAKFRTSFLKRVRNRNSVLEETYKVDGIDIQVISAKRTENGVVVSEPCRMFGSFVGKSGTLRDVVLYDHSIKGVGLDKLPVVGNQRYLLGIDFGAKEKEAIDSIRKEFLSEMAKFIKAEFGRIEKGDLAQKIIAVAISSQVAKAFKKSSSKCYEVLDETQRQILLENRMGFELSRKGAHVFESKVFCEQLNIDEIQQSKIRELIEVADGRLADLESLEKKKLEDLDVRIESEISKTVTEEQLEILDEIR